MKEITLIQCVDTKLDEAAPAKELYDSNYFNLMQDYAESRDVPYRILSAKHGLVYPETVLEPYDELGLSESQGVEIADQLYDMGVEVVHIVAGMKYTNPLIPELEKRGIDVVEVAQGRIGERMERLKELAE